MVIIAILLDGSQKNIFHPGQEVRGNIRVETKSEIKMRGIRLEVDGAASVVWTEGSDEDRHTYFGHEYFIEFKTYLTGSDKKDSEFFLKPGVHTYPLSFALPNTAPPSFEGVHGSIRYRVQAIIDRPWKTDVSAEIFITVVRWLNLNYESPQLREPVVMRVDKPTVGFCYHFCCIKGFPDIELRINRGCFVPGEKIILSGQLVNKSNTNISKTTINFMQEIEFCANSGGQIYHRTHHHTILSCKQRPKVESGRTDTWSDVAFTVPSTALASRLDGCSIINITHFILVKADFSRGCADSAIRQEIIIGHIPLQGDSRSGGPITTQPLVFTSPRPFQPSTQFSEQPNYSGVHGPGWNQDNNTVSVGHV